MYKEGIHESVQEFLMQSLPSHVKRIAYKVSEESVSVENSDESGPNSLQNILNEILQTFSIQARNSASMVTE